MKVGFNTAHWLSWSFFNLLLVAALGLVMRMKVLFEMPWVNQKHLQLAHAQFAFQAWISQLLLVLLISRLATELSPVKAKMFNRLLGGHQLLSLLLLATLLVSGMGLPGFLLPLLIYVLQAILIAQLYRLYRQQPGLRVAANWLGWGFTFLVFSWLASLCLAGFYMLGKMNLNNYLAWHYTYLHFLYNGWFFFAAITLVMQSLGDRVNLFAHDKTVRWAIVAATLIGVTLSLLWLNLPRWVEMLAGLMAIIQLVAWLIFVRQTGRPFFGLTELKPYRWLVLLAVIAWTIKQLLQPALISDTVAGWAYGFRPIIIAYLHLVLLGVFSLFLLFYSHTFSALSQKKSSMLWVKIFAATVVLNELLLAGQGVTAIRYVLVPGIDRGLLVAALLLFGSALMIWLNSRTKASAA